MISQEKCNAEGVIVGCILELCPNCFQTDEHGNPIIVMENKITWEKM